MAQEVTTEEDEVNDVSLESQIEDPKDLIYIKETLESTDDGIIVIDMENNIKIFNKRFIELLEIPQKIMDSKDFDLVLKFISDNLVDPKSFLAIVKKLSDNISAESFNIVETNKGQIFEYYSKPQRIGEEIAGRVWSFRDITSRKQAEEALKITYVSFHNILESSMDGILVVDKKGCLCFFNRAAEIMFDGKVDERINEILDFPIKDYSVREIDIERIESGPGIAEMLIVETEWEGRYANRLMLRDITERKHSREEWSEHREQLEDQIKQRTNELIQAEKMVALGQLVAGVAHEVNNPLAYMKANTDFIQELLTKIKEDYKEKGFDLKPLTELDELIKVNIDGINRISSITTALKRFAKPGLEDKGHADINQGIRDTLLLVVNKLKHRVSVHEDYVDLPLTLCNIEQLNQVFMNIIMNSSEAIEQGNIWIKTWKRANNIFIEFKDDGKGISEEDLKVIFDPFFTTKENGTGLGLSLSYRIIQNHGGTINVESEVGVGTKITIKLPMVGEND
jgi:PAS domain S-box-containing protein